MIFLQDITAKDKNIVVKNFLVLIREQLKSRVALEIQLWLKKFVRMKLVWIF